MTTSSGAETSLTLSVSSSTIFEQAQHATVEQLRTLASKLASLIITNSLIEVAARGSVINCRFHMAVISGLRVGFDFETPMEDLKLEGLGFLR